MYLRLVSKPQCELTHLLFLDQPQTLFTKMKPQISTANEFMDSATSDHLERYSGLTLTSLISIPFAIRAAIKLGVFDIISGAGSGAHLSPSEIAAKLPTKNPNAAISLERIFRMLVTNAILTVSHRPAGESDGSKRVESVYGLGKLGECLVSSATSVAPSFMLSVDKMMVDGFYHLEEAVLEEGCEPFVKAHGENLFEYVGKDSRAKKVFHEAMKNGSVLAVNVIFDGYKGFEGCKEILDVGGGTGASISEIVARYPHIRGRNFDLPYVIKNAPQFPGVEHIAGNMFETVPNSETIYMKSILHDWDDEQCVEILKNCWKALPEGGKVINVELVIPKKLENDVESLRVLGLDLTMMACCPRGRERTIAEFEDLGKAAGFAQVKDFQVAPALHVVEFHKKM